MNYSLKHSCRWESWITKAFLAAVALLLLAVSSEALHAQEPPVLPEEPELIGPPVYFEEFSSGLGTSLPLLSEGGEFIQQVATVLPDDTQESLSVAPEPTSLWLVGAGCLFLAAQSARMLSRRLRD